MSISKFVVRTPLIKSVQLPHLYLKPENLQPFGSYKLRGVSHVAANTSFEKLREGLVTISAGNMAQAVAFAARELSVPCTIYVPDTAPEIKKQAIKKLGARLEERNFSEIWSMVQAAENPEKKGILIHPTETPLLTKGYGAIAKELHEDMSDMDAVVIPFGVGGLSIGVISALKELGSNAHVYLAEPTTAAPMYASLRNSKATRVSRELSFIDAIGTPEVLPPVFERVAPFIKDSIKVEIKEAEEAVATVFRSHRMIVEGAAACSFVAAAKLSSRYKKIACILSGGNIDNKVLTDILERQ